MFDDPHLKGLPPEIFGDPDPESDTNKEKDDTEYCPLEAAVIDWGALVNVPLPERRFAWNPWLPASKVAILNAAGAVGKSLLALQIGVAYALGERLFGGETEGRPVLAVMGEDDLDETRRRISDICRKIGKRPHQIDGLHIIPDFGEPDMTLVRIDGRTGEIVPTKMGDRLVRLIEKKRPGLVILDNAAIMFAINENDRTEVTRCIGFLRSICHKYNTTILVICHNNKAGDFSGSTAWPNASRCRLSMTRNAIEGTTTLCRVKANYADNGEVTLKWEEGVFRCLDFESMSEVERIEAHAKLKEHCEIFLRALDKRNAQGRAMSEKSRAQNYAPREIVADDLNENATERELAAAMRALFNDGQIVAGMAVGKNKSRQTTYGIGRFDGAGDE